MASAHDDGERVHFETADEWGDWLDVNHARDHGVWLVRWRKQSGRPVLSYDDAVVEALRFGWIDSVQRKLDDSRTMLWFAPRRPGSAWSRLNKQRIARLKDDDRLEPAGRAKVETAQRDGTWNLLDEVEDLIVPDDLAAAFAAHPGSRDQWEQFLARRSRSCAWFVEPGSAKFPPSTQRGILEWIVQAKRAATRDKRIDETARLAAEGRRANQWPRQ